MPCDATEEPRLLQTPVNSVRRALELELARDLARRGEWLHCGINNDVRVHRFVGAARPAAATAAPWAPCCSVACEDVSDSVAMDAQATRDVAIAAPVLVQSDDGPALLFCRALAARRRNGARATSSSSSEEVH